MRMTRPKCKCGSWQYWATDGERPRAWAHDGMLTQQGFCFGCNCRLSRDGTVTPMAEALQEPMQEREAARMMWEQAHVMWEQAQGVAEAARARLAEAEATYTKAQTEVWEAGEAAEEQEKAGDTLRDKLVTALCNCDSTHTPRLLPGHMRELVAAMVGVLREEGLTE